jgi:hypothetical protein
LFPSTSQLLSLIELSKGAVNSKEELFDVIKINCPSNQNIVLPRLMKW